MLRKATSNFSKTGKFLERFAGHKYYNTSTRALLEQQQLVNHQRNFNLIPILQYPLVSKFHTSLFNYKEFTMQNMQPVPGNAINISQARNNNIANQQGSNAEAAPATPANNQQQKQAHALHPSLQPVVLQPIAYVESCFREKNGCPRQPLLATLAKARIEISSKVFNNPYGTLEGIEGFSHIWIMFLFHLNDNIAANYVGSGQQQQQDEDAATTTSTSEEPAAAEQTQPEQQQQQQGKKNDGKASSGNSNAQQQQSSLFDKTSVRPPRMDGTRLGVFACRAPYRPNPIGITVAKLESIEKKQGNMILHLSGIDLVDTTPIIDIKYVFCFFLNLQFICKSFVG